MVGVKILAPSQTYPIMQLRLIASLLIAVSALAGCASGPPRQIPASATQGIKRFGVVSVVGSEFIRQHVGFTVFGNERDVKAISNWELDKEYESQLGTAAERSLGATYIKTEHLQGDFVKVNDPNGPWDAPAFSDPNWKGIEASAKAVCQKESLDALFVLTRRKSGDTFGGANQQVAGVGIYSRRGISLLHIISTGGLLDCKTSKPLGERTLTQTLPLSEELARAPISSWSTNSEDRIRSTLVDLPPNVWEDALRSLVQ